MSISELGQYFTIDEGLQEMVFKFIKNKPKYILEPSVGKGHLLKKIVGKINYEKIICYEIDKNVKFLFTQTERKTHNIHLKYNDFLEVKIDQKFETIIGNPPYVKTTTGNLYIDFIDKCYDLLTDDGEMIMIVPSDVLKSTMGTTVRNKLLLNGSITDIYHPNNDRLFHKATIDVIVFRYQKGLKIDTVMYNDEQKRLVNNGVITFEDITDDNVASTQLDNIFDIYVGIVSGAEEVFKVPFGNAKIRNSEQEMDSYILIKSFPTKSKKINNHLLEHKEQLLDRRIRKFNERNWFEWGALRNIGKVSDRKKEPCIYIKTLTRQPNVAFKSTVDYFGGGLLILIPKTDLEYNINLDEFVEYFNSDTFRKKYIQSGRFKIGHRQLCLSTVKLE
jgi:adenine-specific DNA-methyltransferase